MENGQTISRVQRVTIHRPNRGPILPIVGNIISHYHYYVERMISPQSSWNSWRNTIFLIFFFVNITSSQWQPHLHQWRPKLLLGTSQSERISSQTRQFNHGFDPGENLTSKSSEVLTNCLNFTCKTLSHEQTNREKNPHPHLPHCTFHAFFCVSVSSTTFSYPFFHL